MVFRQQNWPSDTVPSLMRDMVITLNFDEAVFESQRLEGFRGMLRDLHPAFTPTTLRESVAFEKRRLRFEAMEEMLNGFSELPRNWDSFGSPALSLDAIGEVKGILTGAIDLDLPEPWVAPGADAGIGIQWDTDGAELYIDVVPGEETTYVLTLKAGSSFESDGTLTAENLSRVLGQFAESAT